MIDSGQGGRGREPATEITMTFCYVKTQLEHNRGSVKIAVEQESHFEKTTELVVVSAAVSAAPGQRARRRPVAWFVSRRRARRPGLAAGSQAWL